MKIKTDSEPIYKNPSSPFAEERKQKQLTYYVDLDGTLAEYDNWGNIDDIGEPILKMKKRVLNWIKDGIKIKIFTARLYNPESKKYIKKWLLLNGFPQLEITNIKGIDCDRLFDNCAREVINNTGIIVDRMGEFNNE